MDKELRESRLLASSGRGRVLTQFLTLICTHLISLSNVNNTTPGPFH